MSGTRSTFVAVAVALLAAGCAHTGGLSTPHGNQIILSQAGVIAGGFESWYANDQKRAKATFQGGVPEGEFKAWHINGEVSEKGQYVGGKKNGCWETWHENGQKASKGTYNDDKQVVTWLF